MRIRTAIIKKIKDFPSDRGRDFRLKLALALGKSENQVRLYINDNSENLTKAAALAVIRKEMELSDDQILESNLIDEKIK